MIRVCRYVVSFSGYGRCLVYKNTKATVKTYQNGTVDRIKGPLTVEGKLHPSHSKLDYDGVVTIGAYVKNREVRKFTVISCKIIGKQLCTIWHDFSYY